MLLTTSWDDGHPSDLRLAERLHHHGIAATFYCPLHNREGLPVMSTAQRRTLAAAGFEIGGHTHDHVYADRTPRPLWRQQVRQGREALEDGLGQAIAGFCYPGGRQGAAARAIVEDAGFRYARTTRNLCLDAGPDRWQMATTLQFYPHPRSVLLRNFLGGGGWARRARAWRHTARAPGLLDRLQALLALARQQGSGPPPVLHLWGHAWELDRFDLWPQLDEALRGLADAVPPADRLTNLDTLRRLGRLDPAS